MISLPFARDFIANTEDVVLQNQLLNAIEMAKREAVAQHAPVALSVDNHQKIIIFLDEYADGIAHDHEQIITVMQSQSAHGSIHFRAFKSRGNYLIFSPMGLMKNDNASFWHCHDHAPMWAIIMGKTGRIRMTYPDKQNEIKDGNNQPLSC